MDASTIGQYRIVETLGQGGMGIVFRARHLASERAVALKTVRLPAPRWLDSIRREIQALTRVRHPGVVRIVDHGVHEGRPWYAMDLLEGETLRQFGRRIWSPYQAFEGVAAPISQTEEVTGVSELHSIDDLPLHEAHWAAGQRAALSGVTTAAAGELIPIMRVMRRLCASLAFMHGEGFINRDLKPENIVLVDGVPVIIDFGLTTHHPGNSGREELEAQHGVAGTVHYMSPEQIRGEFVDARSDLYAIGCILYELVCGRPPFAGAPRAVMLQHLNATPVAPSRRVDGVPAALDQLIMKLLEKQTGRRIGYADEVAAELAELSQDAPRLAEYPPARSYLYRPGFVGREELVSQLVQLRDQTLLGQGTMVLLGGESGAGKTRVAMELTRTRKQTMRLITSETASLAAEGEARIATSPMQALRPLLRAIADECQAGGRETTERLLGEHQAVLSVYEPLLSQLPAFQSVELPPALGPEASRRRVFRALRETLARFAKLRPLLFVIDDLGWVDEVTQAFLSSLDQSFFADTPLLLVCTYRSEEMSDVVTQLLGQPHVRAMQLPRLGEGPVRSMVSDMLALAEPEDAFVEFVTREAEGNPFFVAEYLRAAVSERVLYRDQMRTWQVRTPTRAQPESPLALSLPRSLRALIDQRLKSLGTAAKQVSLAAAVLGREMEFSVLRQVSGLPDSTCISAVDELVRRQVLEQTELGSLRFMHDKLREETYRGSLPGALRELHARAAATLESLLPEGSAAASSWALLGNHFTAAALHDKAVHYLRLAAEHAQQSSAHSDALTLYRQAIEQGRTLERELPLFWRPRLLALHEAYADLLTLLGKRDDARVAYQAAFDRADAQPVLLSRLHRKVGKTWESQHVHDKALEQYQLAARYVSAPADASQEERDEWLQVRLDQMLVHYWIGDLEQLDALGNELSPFIAAASAPQRARFFGAQLKSSMRRERYLLSEQTLDYGRAQVDACRLGGLQEDLPTAFFEFGFALFFAGAFLEAEAALESALSLARKNGDAALQTRCLNYLTMCARMTGDVETTLQLAAQSVIAAEALSMQEYAAAAWANQAWARLCRGEREHARTLAKSAIAVWTKFGLYPFEWMALTPLLHLSLLEGELDQAIACARALLAPRQIPLPGTAPAALQGAVDKFDAGRQIEAQADLDRVLEELPEGYC